MSFPGPRGPIIIPIPINHFDQIDTTQAASPTILKLRFTSVGINYFRQTIFPYIWQGYQVKLRCSPVRDMPADHASDDNTNLMKTNIVDFYVRGSSGGGLTGDIGVYIQYPGANTDGNNMIRFRQETSGNPPSVLYTENGVEYSCYSYVIYP